MRSAVCRVLLAAAVVSAAPMPAGAAAVAADAYPAARFTDPERVAKLEGALPQIDRVFRDYAAEKRIPGMVWGIVIDDRLAHVAATGSQDLAQGAAATADSVFRIASMTKSFTVLAILKLRDAGKLSLDDPVARWLPQFPRAGPTRDSAPVTLRQLLSHSAGFPEDNPWGDQQLAASDAALTQWLGLGIPYANPPGTRYEYSNLAFGMLGRIVAKAAGEPYETYVSREILERLNMRSSTFNFAQVPDAVRAVGYRLLPDGTYRVEPPLPHGAFGAAGGLLTTAADLGRYVAFHLAAWPPRDAPDDGPVRRSSVREMSQMWTPANLTARFGAGRRSAVQSGYGYGLRVSIDCRFEHIVAHGGGLPGFGSYMAWLPDYGVGIFAMTNLTYAGPAEAVNRAWDELGRSGGLRKRELPASPMLTRMHDPIFALWNSWDDARVRQIGAMNLLLDEPAEQRKAEIETLKAEVGDCPTAGPVEAEDWLRGQFTLSCARGLVGVFYTLAPTAPPAVQYLAFRKVESAAVRLAAPTGAPAGVSCSD